MSPEDQQPTKTGPKLATADGKAVPTPPSSAPVSQKHWLESIDDLYSMSEVLVKTAEETGREIEVIQLVWDGKAFTCGIGYSAKDESVKG